MASLSSEARSILGKVISGQTLSGQTLSDQGLIFGQNGQLARAIIHTFESHDYPVTAIGSAQCDLVKVPHIATELITHLKPSYVINASAYTDVDEAEDPSHRQALEALNIHAPLSMAKACAQLEIPFLHMSTDYVFNGRVKLPYAVDHPKDPINAYGRSKADGEAAILSIGGFGAIIRTSWLYDGKGKNFLTTMLRLGAQKDRIHVVNDQIGRPTYAGHLARACMNIVMSAPDEMKVYHVSDSGAPISWYDFAKAIFTAKQITCEVLPVTSVDYAAPALRPAYSGLDLCAYEQDYNTSCPDWKTGLNAALAEWDARS